jgi:hypothetical protein
VYLPPGTTIDARDDERWEYPVGTRFWKEFSFDGRKVETRMLWKTSTERWIAVSYRWNEDGTDATLAPREGSLSAAEVAPGRRHAIPARDECLMCHGARHTAPLGFNALQLSTDRDPGAIHRETLRPEMVTMQTLLDEGLVAIASTRANPDAAAARIRTADPSTRAVLGYLFANCGGCHDGRGEIAALAPVLRARDLQQDGDAVAARLLRQPTHWQVPGVPEGASIVIDPETPGNSALLVRMRSRRPSSQMPPLGTLRRDEEALTAISNWIHAVAGSVARSSKPRSQNTQNTKDTKDTKD